MPGPGRRFEKGNKFAKGGRRVGSGQKPSEATILKEKLADYADCAIEAFQFNVQLMRDVTEPKPLRREASKEIMDRLWGKAKQAVEHSGDIGVVELILRAAQDEPRS